MLENYQIILGSASPRRRELLSSLDLDFTVQLANIAEEFPDEMSEFEVAEYLARLKSTAFKPFKNQLIITADSVVIMEGKILGKPKSINEARQTLNHLSNKWHTVISGVCIKNENKIESFSVSTEVEMTKISEDEIEYYINNHHPFDKAGSYGIQEWIGWAKVKQIRGSYSNVMGLPCHELYETLKDWN